MSISCYSDTYNFETLKDSMLQAITREIDKREGSLTTDAISSVAMELDALYKHLDYIVKNSFADSSDREFLIRRCAERGIEPYLATASIVKGEFNIELDPATKFSLVDGTLSFFVDSLIEVADGMYYYKLRCADAGVQGNVGSGKLLPAQTIQGLTSAKIVSLLIPGEDQEETEILRTRFLESFKAESFCGNREDYVKRINAMQGVGAVKAYRAEVADPGKVSVVFLDSTYSKPSEFLVSEIQEAVDPLSMTGAGHGIAPICHSVIVSAASEVVVNVELALELVTGYYYPSLEATIKSTIEEYFLSLRKSWESEGDEGIVVRVARLEVALLGIVGIKDVLSLRLNALTSNITLDKNSIPILGVVSHV